MMMAMEKAGSAFCREVPWQGRGSPSWLLG